MGNNVRRMEKLTSRAVARITPTERKRLQAACREMGITESNFLRACINRELAMSLDPAAIKALSDTFSKGMKEVVQKLVDTGIQEAKKRQK